MGPLPLQYKAFFQPVLTYASPEWFPFLTVTNICKVKRLHRAASRAITGCLSSSPIPILSEASLPSLQFTRTHFALSSNERALRLPTSFPISLLARPGSETKTLKIFLELLRPLTRLRSLLLLLVGFSLLALSSLEPAFLHCGVHPFLFMLPL